MGVARKKKQRDETQLQAANIETLDVFPHKTQHGNGKKTQTQRVICTQKGGGVLGVVMGWEKVNQSGIRPVRRGFLVNKQPH